MIIYYNYLLNNIMRHYEHLYTQASGKVWHFYWVIYDLVSEFNCILWDICVTVNFSILSKRSRLCFLWAVLFSKSLCWHTHLLDESEKMEITPQWHLIIMCKSQPQGAGEFPPSILWPQVCVPTCLLNMKPLQCKQGGIKLCLVSLECSNNSRSGLR